MRRCLAPLLLMVPMLAGAAQPAEGRWQGTIHIPARDLAVVVDLARDSSGAWSGSMILPGLGVKGAPLSNIAVRDRDVVFDAGSALRAEKDAPATFKARLTATSTMAGAFTQAGNVARFELTRVGAAQVDAPPRGTRVRPAIVGEWTGAFELGGYPRQVTIDLQNTAANGAASAKFVVVGKQTTDVPVDFVSDEGDLVRIESRAHRVAFEGRVVDNASEIRGTVELGPYELPLVLHRATHKSS
jgi:hypothetical protein